MTVWGVILPVGFLSFAGWIWFKSDVFPAAWNPHGLSLGEGMGSSIALTLWAFLGMESAAQNSAAVENPKRDVPLACMFGTLGAAVIYILSTTVIQGIVPNDELAKSTGPFGLAYAHMFNPTIGSIVMGLAVIACLGSLLGWQFTIATTGKSAADERMFPAFFSKVNKLGAPITGMIVLGVVQSAAGADHDLAQPERAVQRPGESGGGHQRDPLRGEPVGPDRDDADRRMSAQGSLPPQRGDRAGRDALQRLRPLGIRQGCGHGRDAGHGCCLHHLGIHRAPLHICDHGGRQVRESRVKPETDTVERRRVMHSAGWVTPRGHRTRFLASALGTLIVTLTVAAEAQTPRMKPTTQTGTSTLERIKTAGTIRLGYLSDARPYSYKDESGNPAGFSVAVCQKLAGAVSAQPNLTGVKVEWVELTLADRFNAVKEGKVDLLCGADTETLSRRQDVDFSIPIFPGGIGALLRTDAPARLREILNGRPQSSPTWRASAGALIQKQIFVVVPGTTSEPWLKQQAERVQPHRHREPVSKASTPGIQAVHDRHADVFFTDRAVLLDAMKRNSTGDLARWWVILDRYFTYESLRLALQRGDEDFRLAVDRGLSNLYRSGDLVSEYTKDFGTPDDKAKTFYQWITLPE